MSDSPIRHTGFILTNCSSLQQQQPVLFSLMCPTRLKTTLFTTITLFCSLAARNSLKESKSMTCVGERYVIMPGKLSRWDLTSTLMLQVTRWTRVSRWRPLGQDGLKLTGCVGSLTPYLIMIGIKIPRFCTCHWSLQLLYFWSVAHSKLRERGKSSCMREKRSLCAFTEQSGLRLQRHQVFCPIRAV